MTSEQIKPYIWKNIESKEELLQYELFQELHKVYCHLESGPVMFPMDELKIMNEVGFGVEWLRFNYNVFNDAFLEQLVREVYADMGLKDHAEAVLSLIYATVAIVNWPPVSITKHDLRELQKMNRDSWCYRHVVDFIRRVNKAGKLIVFPFELSQEMEKEVRRITKELQTTIVDGVSRVLKSYPEGLDDDICVAEEGESLTNPSSTTIYDEPSPRYFTLDEIVNYAKENLTLDSSVTIQTMLYSLLVENGTKEERAKVASIPKGIQERQAQPSYIGQLVGQQSIFGNLDGLEELIKAIPQDKIKQIIG